MLNAGYRQNCLRVLRTDNAGEDRLVDVAWTGSTLWGLTDMGRLYRAEGNNFVLQGAPEVDASVLSDGGVTLLVRRPHASQLYGISSHQLRYLPSTYDASYQLTNDGVGQL